MYISCFAGFRPRAGLWLHAGRFPPSFPGQIRRLLGCLAVAVLVMAMGMEIAGASSNKASAGQSSGWWMQHVSSAGHGGEGGEMRDVWPSQTCCLVDFFPLASLHSAGGPSWMVAHELRRWEIGEVDVRHGSPVNKCKVLALVSIRNLFEVLGLLAGRGGGGRKESRCCCLEREEGVVFALRMVFIDSASSRQVVAARERERASPTFLFSGETMGSFWSFSSPWRLFFAAAILGQRPGPAMPDSVACSGSAYLLWRLFFNPAAPSQAATQPSGVVPGLSSGGCVWWLLVDGVLLELDFVFELLFRVFSAYFKGLVVFSYFCKALRVNVHPPSLKEKAAGTTMEPYICWAPNAAA